MPTTIDSPPTSATELLSVDAVAARLGVSRSRVLTLGSSGKLTRHRRGRHVFYDALEVAVYAATPRRPGPRPASDDAWTGIQPRVVRCQCQREVVALADGRTVERAELIPRAPCVGCQGTGYRDASATHCYLCDGTGQWGVDLHQLDELIALSPAGAARTVHVARPGGDVVQRRGEALHHPHRCSARIGTQ